MRVGSGTAIAQSEFECAAGRTVSDLICARDCVAAKLLCTKLVQYPCGVKTTLMSQIAFSNAVNAMSWQLLRLAYCNTLEDKKARRAAANS